MERTRANVPDHRAKSFPERQGWPAKTREALALLLYSLVAASPTKLGIGVAAAHRSRQRKLLDLVNEAEDHPCRIKPLLPFIRTPHASL